MAKNKSKAKKQRERIKFLGIDLSNQEIDPEINGVSFNLKIDLTKRTMMAVNSLNNEVIENNTISFGYIGVNKIRHTSEIKTNPDDFTYCFTSKIERFKHIYAIDTNTFSFYGVHLKREIKLGLGIAIGLAEDENNYIFNPIPLPFVTNMEVEKPENENWVRLICLVSENCRCSDERKIGIVVDSDLGNIQNYNDKRLPIFGDFYLPDNYELIFASDKVTDNIFNRMISLSHKLSKETIPIFIDQYIKNETLK
jgi:hypothetical protein